MEGMKRYEMTRTINDVTHTVTVLAPSDRQAKRLFDEAFGRRAKEGRR